MVLTSSNSVSYTHLDVYKRQPLQRTQAARPGIRRQVHGRMVRDVRLSRRYPMRTLGHYAARVRVRGYDFPLSFSCGEPLRMISSAFSLVSLVG